MLRHRWPSESQAVAQPERRKGWKLVAMARRRHFTDAATRALFHGTNKELSPGDVISPGMNPVTLGIPEGDEHRGLAFATESLDLASSYANRAVYRHGGQFRVYRVDPVDDSVRHEGEGEFSSPSGFRIRRLLPLSDARDPRIQKHNEHLQDYYESRGL